ncbi:hypothetical protein EUAN_06730 [Andreesenia angusta]|uniref:Uncharacterized protein n=1 Tax=Andreesenia angusta TaxID=39480 RepID=A0A1S1VAN9_9FIRM|nr:hypothetical protein [Andreesenia angusta]OHW62889.1 hypothetical protein EUAN_06730 [Andreesenia angusta]
MININSIFEFGVIFMVSLTGALGNDYYKTLTGSEERVNVARVTIGAFTGAMLLNGATARFDALKGVDDKQLMTLAFLSGVFGFAILGLILRIDLKKMLSKKGLEFKNDKGDEDYEQ